MRRGCSSLSRGELGEGDNFSQLREPRADGRTLSAEENDFERDRDRRGPPETTTSIPARAQAVEERYWCGRDIGTRPNAVNRAMLSSEGSRLGGSPVGETMNEPTSEPVQAIPVEVTAVKNSREFLRRRPRRRQGRE